MAIRKAKIRWRRNTAARQCSEGFSLLSFVIALAIFSIIALLFVGTRARLMSIAKRTRAHQLYQNELQSILSFIEAQTFVYIQDVTPTGYCGSNIPPNIHCLGNPSIPQLAVDFPQTSLGPYGTVQFSTAVNPWPDSPTANAAIIQRCANPAPINCGPPFGAGNSFYFCLNFQRNLASMAVPPANSLFHDTKLIDPATGQLAAAAEVYVVLKDLAFDLDKSCSDYLGFSTAGERIYYSLYWETVGEDNAPVLRRKNGVVLVPKSSYITQ